MERLIVQLGNKQGRAANVVRSREGSLTVGRSYDNDLVLTDIHIAPAQVTFQRTEDQWSMHILDQTNPVLLNDQPITGDMSVVRSGDRVTLGRTRLTIYADDHPVEPTKKLVLYNWLERHSPSVLTAIGFLVTVCLADLGFGYLLESTDLKWSEFAYAELWAVVVIVIWAGIWALAGRVIRQQPRFLLQLMVTTFTYLLVVVLTLTLGYFIYLFHNPQVTELAYWALAFIALVVLFRLNLLVATHVERTLLVSVILAAAILGVIYSFVLLSETEEFVYEPEFSQSLMPPLFGEVGGKSSEHFFSALEETANKAEAQAQEEE